MQDKVHDEPSTVETEEDVVYVDGPDGVAVALTPEAADETGERLIGKAAEAAGNRRIAKAARKQA